MALLLLVEVYKNGSLLSRCIKSDQLLKIAMFEHDAPTVLGLQKSAIGSQDIDRWAQKKAEEFRINHELLGQNTCLVKQRPVKRS